MRFWLATMLTCMALHPGLSAAASDQSLEQLIRGHTFNDAGEGSDFYSITILEDRSQTDGSREVVAVASGRFLERTRRLKILFLLAGNQVIGGQVLEETGLPACHESDEPRAS